MTKSLPESVQQVFERFVTTEYTTIDAHGQPITWPVVPHYEAGDATIDITTGVDAARNPFVSLLFSDQTGSGIEHAPMVLVQGVAEFDDKDVKVRPERVYVWADGNPEVEPVLLDSHMDEVRSGHDEEPESAPPAPSGAPANWDPRLDALGTRSFPTAVLTLVAPDGFPFSIRVPVHPDEAAGCIRFDCDALGLPVAPGLACLAAHIHAPDLTWQNNFQVRGDFVERDGDWVLVPHEYVDGFHGPMRRRG